MSDLPSWWRIALLLGLMFLTGFVLGYTCGRERADGDDEEEQADE